MTDTVIIGGGAAGLMTAVKLKEISPKSEVTVLESSDRVGKKLLVTGNGRCNISNIDLNASRYHGDCDFAERIINNFDFDAQKSFFGSLGVLFCELEEGKVYPKSLQAGSVVDALRFRAEELGVKIVLNSKVTEVKRSADGFSVLASGKEIVCRTVVVATGGQAGGKLGSCDGYTILKSMGHKIEKVFPSIVQVKTTPQIVRQLKGIKVMANVTLSSSVGTRCEFGEVLFCDYGLSGPPVLQVSRLAEGENATVSLDLLPDMTENEIKSEVLRRADVFGNRPLGELFMGFLNKRLGQVVLKSLGLDINSQCREITEKTAQKTAETLKNWKFRVTGTTGFENAQVTAGGAQTAQFFDSCMSKKAKGLFAVGEVLNVDGDCGGFNLAFCWASGFAAALGLKDYLEKC